MSKELSVERLKACETCPRLFRPTMTCKACGCFLLLKTRMPHSTCPEGRWSQ